jgi:hypothetical protein
MYVCMYAYVKLYLMTVDFHKGGGSLAQEKDMMMTMLKHSLVSQLILHINLVVIYQYLSKQYINIH